MILMELEVEDTEVIEFKAFSCFFKNCLLLCSACLLDGVQGQFNLEG